METPEDSGVKAIEEAVTPVDAGEKALEEAVVPVDVKTIEEAVTPVDSGVVVIEEAVAPEDAGAKAIEEVVTPVDEPPAFVPTYVATADHAAASDQELSFVVGDNVLVNSPVEGAEIWSGECNGNQGTFPSAKVTLGVSSPALPPAPASTDATEIYDAFIRFRRLWTVFELQKQKMPHHSLIIPPQCVRLQPDTCQLDGFENIHLVPDRPLLVFYNPKSGGTKGKAVGRALRSILNPAQVIDMLHGGPGVALKQFGQLKQFRVLVCGGDGSVAWVLSCIDDLGLCERAWVSVMPLGTGNDMSRVLGWGPGYDSKRHSRLLTFVEHSPRVSLDRWRVTIKLRNGTTQELWMNNYFSVGMSAKLAMQFHEARKKNPERFQSRTFNKFFYFLDGLRDSIVHSCKNLQQNLEISSNSEPLALGGCEEVILLNIPSYAGGIDLWNGGSRPQSRLDDGRFELVSVSGSFQMGAVKVGLAAPHRLGQFTELHIRAKKPMELPIQVDGEPDIVDFEEISIIHHGVTTMLRKDKSQVPPEVAKSSKARPTAN